MRLIRAALMVTISFAMSAPILAESKSVEITVTRTARDFYKIDSTGDLLQVRDCAADAVSRKAIYKATKGTGGAPSTATLTFLGEFYEPVCEIIRYIK